MQYLDRIIYLKTGRSNAMWSFKIAFKNLIGADAGLLNVGYCPSLLW